MTNRRTGTREHGYDPVAALVRENHEKGVTPTYSTGRATFRREDEIPLYVLARVAEAVE